MILKQFTTPNGATTTFHILKRVNVEYPFTEAALTVHSYTNEDAYLLGAGIVWNNPILMPLSGEEIGIGASAEDWLISAIESPFHGGSLVADSNATLESAKLRTWTRIKLLRDAAEQSPFEYDGDVYQSDKERITGATQLALLAQIGKEPYSIDWTLLDNTIRTLDAVGMINVGIALGQHVLSVFAIGRQLREQIASATTIEELNAINWPTVSGE